MSARPVTYSVASSLDGHIARSDGSFDWIPEEPDVDWGALLGRFDTVVMGRRTWDAVGAAGGGGPTAGKEAWVFSTTLEPEVGPSATITDRDPVEVVRELREGEGKGIWLMGGGVLFRTLLDAGLVDRVEVAVVPVLLGEGIPLLAGGGRGARLELREHRRMSTGIVMLEYDVVRG